MMSALLIKDAPKGLHEWLQTEAHLNRRSLSQQVLLCLEWCMRIYDVPQLRNHFATFKANHDVSAIGNSAFARGTELVKRLMSIGSIDSSDAAQMKRDVRNLRRSKSRKFDYACFN